MIASIAHHRHLSHFIAKYRAVSRLRYCEKFPLGQGWCRTGGPWEENEGQRRRRSDSTFNFKQRQWHAPQRGACHCQERIRQLVVFTPGSCPPQLAQPFIQHSSQTGGLPRLDPVATSSVQRPPIPRWCPVRAWLFFTFLHTYMLKTEEWSFLRTRGESSMNSRHEGPQ